MVQRAQYAGCDILSSAEVGMGTGKQKTAGMSRAAKPFILTLDISEVFCYFVL